MWIKFQLILIIKNVVTSYIIQFTYNFFIVQNLKFSDHIIVKFTNFKHNA